MSIRKSKQNQIQECVHNTLPIMDTIEVLAGKWKYPIISTLMMHGPLCFMDLRRELNTITAKVLIKELRALEMHQLIERNIQNTNPVTVRYSMTEYGMTMQPVITEMLEWGKIHRKRITGK